MFSIRIVANKLKRYDIWSLKYMNTQLVSYLVGVINNLTGEEKSLLKKQLADNNINYSSEECYQELLKLKANILNRRQGKPLTINPDDLLFQLRNERDAELMSIGLENLHNNNS